MPPVIDADKCTACGDCVEICTEDVFFGSVEGEIPVVTYPRECVHFSGCVYVCPVEDAIKLRIPLPMLLVYRSDPL
ncbi:ferredoxin family protein [candidate division KSB1 bacterium]